MAGAAWRSSVWGGLGNGASVRTVPLLWAVAQSQAGLAESEGALRLVSPVIGSTTIVTGPSTEHKTNSNAPVAPTWGITQFGKIARPKAATNAKRRVAS